MSVTSQQWRIGGTLAALALVLGAVFLFWGKGPAPTVDLAQLEDRDGRAHLPGQEQPFTGIAVEYYDSGTLKSRTHYRDGQLHGQSQGFYPDGGAKQVVEHFQHGVSHGFRTKWYADGTMASRGLIENGQFNGAFRRWNEAGQLVTEVQLKDGVANGRSRVWDASGRLVKELVMKDGVEISRLSGNEENDG